MASPIEQTPRGARELSVTSPWDGQEIGRIDNQSAAEVQAAVDSAREAQRRWAALDVSDRARHLKRLRGVFLQRAEELIDILVRENGKTREEAIYAEILGSAMHMAFTINKGPRAIRPRRIRKWGMSLLTRSNIIHYVPRGVVGIISPWNYPLAIPISDAFPAWLAGNAVVLKPSEHASLAPLVFKEIFDDANLDPDLFQVVTGLGPTGAALIDSGIDKMVFTGSVKVGRIVGASCAERLIPCTLELGGKAAVVALDDCDIERTARAIVWGGFFNAGQTCIGVERVFAQQPIYEDLLKRTVELTKSLRLGDRGDLDMGAMPFAKQVDTVANLVDDARDKGAAILTGGQRTPGPGRFYPPTVVANTTRDMDIMSQEIFGPAIPFAPFAEDEDAVRLNNDSPLGLNTYVFGGARRRTYGVARQLRAGTVMINDVVSNFAYPELPFGGVKDSGVGRNHGIEGLRAMCESRVISDRAQWPRRMLWWHPYDRKRANWVLSQTGKLMTLLDSLKWF